MQNDARLHNTPHLIRHTPHSILGTQNCASKFRHFPPFFPRCSLSFTALLTAQFTLHTVYLTLHTLHSTLHTRHARHHILHLTLYTPHSMLGDRLYVTPHSTLHVFQTLLPDHFPPFSPCCSFSFTALLTAQFTLHTVYLTLHTLHFTLNTSHSTR